MYLLPDKSTVLSRQCIGSIICSQIIKLQDIKLASDASTRLGVSGPSNCLHMGRVVPVAARLTAD